MDVAIVLFTRDLQIHDNPVLAQACSRARQVVPMFVVDPALAVPRTAGGSWRSPWPTSGTGCASAAAIR